MRPPVVAARRRASHARRRQSPARAAGHVHPGSMPRRRRDLRQERAPTRAMRCPARDSSALDVRQRITSLVPYALDQGHIDRAWPTTGFRTWIACISPDRPPWQPPLPGPVSWYRFMRRNRVRRPLSRRHRLPRRRRKQRRVNRPLPRRTPATSPAERHARRSGESWSRPSGWARSSASTGSSAAAVDRHRAGTCNARRVSKRTIADAGRQVSRESSRSR